MGRYSQWVHAKGPRARLQGSKMRDPGMSVRLSGRRPRERRRFARRCRRRAGRGRPSPPTSGRWWIEARGGARERRRVGEPSCAGWSLTPSQVWKRGGTLLRRVGRPTSAGCIAALRLHDELAIPLESLVRRAPRAKRGPRKARPREAGGTTRIGGASGAVRPPTRLDGPRSPQSLTPGTSSCRARPPRGRVRPTVGPSIARSTP